MFTPLFVCDFPYDYIHVLEDGYVVSYVSFTLCLFQNGYIHVPEDVCVSSVYSTLCDSVVDGSYVFSVCLLHCLSACFRMPISVFWRMRGTILSESVTF